jgi:uncharacterized protein (TIGR02246 family)
MTFLVVGVLFTSSCGSSSSNQSNAAPDPKPINDVRDRYLMAFNSGDAAGVAALYTDDGITLPEFHPPVQGKAAIQQYLQQNFAQTTQRLTLTSPDTKINGNIAYETGSYSITVMPKTAGAKPMSDSGKYLVVLLKQSDGSWKLYSDMDSTNAPMQQPVPAKTAAKKTAVRKAPRTSTRAKARKTAKKA